MSKKVPKMQKKLFTIFFLYVKMYAVEIGFYQMYPPAIHKFAALPRNNFRRKYYADQP